MPITLDGTVRKTFSVNLDLKQPTANRDIEVVEGDTGNVLIVTLTDNGEAVDLSGCLVCAVFAKPDGRTAQQDTSGNGISIAGDNNNEITIDLFSSSFSPGIVTCEIQVYSSSVADESDEDIVTFTSTLVTSAQFNFTCRRGIINDDTVLSTDEWPLLVGMLRDVEAMGDTVEGLNARTTEAANAADAAALRANTAADDAEDATLAANNAAGDATAAAGLANAAAEDADAAATTATAAAEDAEDAAARANAAAAAAEPYVELLNGKADKTRSTAITLLGNGWTGEGPFTQIVAVDGLTGDRFENPDVFAEFTEDIENERAAWNLVDQVVSVEGALEFTCLAETPTIDIPLIVKVRD